MSFTLITAGWLHNWQYNCTTQTQTNVRLGYIMAKYCKCCHQWLCGELVLSAACSHLVDVLVPSCQRDEPRHQRQDPDPAHHHLDHADVAPGDQWFPGLCDWIRYLLTPALSAQGDAVEDPGPLDVDGGDGPDDSHPRHRPHQAVHLRVGVDK